MPRSRNPRNYGTMYQKLVELMDKHEERIELTMGPKQAHAVRHSFYAYIVAMQHEAERVARSGKVELVDYWTRMEDVARGYIVLIEEVTPDTSKLIFVRRDLDDRFQDGIAQLDALLAQNTNPGYADIKQRLEQPAAFKPVDGKKVIDTWMDMAGNPDPMPPGLEDIETPDPTDLSELVSDSDQITPDNQGAPTTQEEYAKLMTGHLKDEEPT